MIEVNRLNRPIEKAIHWLNQKQISRGEDQGCWNGIVQTNCCMEAQWVMLQWFLGLGESDPKFTQVVETILKEQREDGSWEVYYQAPEGDINTTVECYAALRIAGHSPDSEHMCKARQWIFAHGRFKQIRVFTRFWLALIGEWPWEYTPTLPPEIIFLPAWVPMNIYKFSQWARATIVPLTIVSARRPVRPLPPDKRLDELFPLGRDLEDYSLPQKCSLFSLETFFLVMDKFLNAYVKFPVKPFREIAIRNCLEWIIKHQDADGAWGGIQPPWLYSIIAMHVEGYPNNHPAMKAALDAFNEPWALERPGGGLFLQASNSPVWDTELAMLAMIESDYDSNSPQLQKALNWLLDQQVTHHRGDWQVYLNKVKPGGWAFEWENDWYPDTDDTAVAILVLAKLRNSLHNNQRIDHALQLAEQWLVAFQSRNGGFGAFDRDNNSWLVTKIPFCDFGEVLDPPSVDVTAHVVEALAELGYNLKNSKVIANAVNYMKREQELNGAWFGRWGVNYIYGTGAVLPALRAAGEDMRLPYVRKAADWLCERQNEDGGWGETCASYMDPQLAGIGPSCASQTAWALLALLATDPRYYQPAISRSLDYLASTQTKDGTWEEPYYTGTGFPGYGIGSRIDLAKSDNKMKQGKELSRGFMLRYHMYRHYFPLMAIGRARRIYQQLQKIVTKIA